jgi:hypothetical protein
MFEESLYCAPLYDYRCDCNNNADAPYDYALMQYQCSLELEVSADRVEMLFPS